MFGKTSKVPQVDNTVTSGKWGYVQKRLTLQPVFFQQEQVGEADSAVEVKIAEYSYGNYYFIIGYEFAVIGGEAQNLGAGPAEHSGGINGVWINKGYGAGP